MFITRTQHVQHDTVSLMAVQGDGTDKFQESGQPRRTRANFGVALSGDLRVTKSETSRGYFFLMVGTKRGQVHRRTFFRGDALVRVGSGVYTVDNYWRLLCAVNGD